MVACPCLYRLVSLIYVLIATSFVGYQDNCELFCKFTEYAKDADCSNRGITVMPACYDSAHLIDFSGNSLESVVVSQLSFYSELRYLLLQRNQIAYLGKNFLAGNTKLELVNLTRNSIEHLHSFTFVDTYFKFLILKYNQIESIHQYAFFNAGSIRKIYLQNNRLKYLHRLNFEHLPNLLEINLSNNRISIFHLDVLNKVPSFRKIFLQSNELTAINGQNICNHTNLAVINLAFNSIKMADCGFLPEIPNLEHLILSHNPIEKHIGCEGDDRIVSEYTRFEKKPVLPFVRVFPVHNVTNF